MSPPHSADDAKPSPPAWLPEIQRPPSSIPDKATRPAPPLFNALHQPIRTKDAWIGHRFGLAHRWTEFLGTIQVRQPVSHMKVLEEDRPDGVIRWLVRYEAEPGLPVEGYLLRPEGEPKRKRPGVVVLHSTVDYTIRQPAGLEGPEDKHIGMHLARRGYVAFCPRCYLWQYGRAGHPDEAVEWLKKRRPRITGMAKMLFDAQRAVDLLAGLPDVDPKRLGAIGHSLGAKEVLYLSAFDTRIRATVSSEGGVGITYSNWDAPWYLGEAVSRPGFPLDHGQILALSAPRAFLLIGGDSADGDISWPYIEAALPVWKLMDAADAVGLFNHRKGHEFPALAQTRAYEFLDWFTRPV
jgi:Dienelactone hydrolase family